MEMERRIWHVGTAVIILVTILSFRLAYWQLVRGEELQPVVLSAITRSNAPDDPKIETLDTNTLETFESLPLPVQQRTSEVLANIVRGSIFDSKGRLLASDFLDENGDHSRTYAEPVMAPIIGYTSGLRVGLTGIEQHFNETLFGLDRFDGQISRLIHQPITGNDVYLTIDTNLQKAVAEALGNRAGAIVVMNAKTVSSRPLCSTPPARSTGSAAEEPNTCGRASPDSSRRWIRRHWRACWTWRKTRACGPASCARRRTT
jgi:hypothetical protein